ncbi:hypothetical protein C0991_011956 [Blastosporella zonata]|nr:hypothetical protein C0991_011956 [Blastosporella zonata]
MKVLSPKSATREELQKQPAYTPDLSYLTAGKSSGLASRLAAGVTSSATKAPRVLSQPPLHSAPKQVIHRESDEERDRRTQAITATRRAERLAREDAAAAAQKARQEDQVSIDASYRASAERAALLTAQRMAERLKREAQMAHQRLENRTLGTGTERAHHRPRGGAKAGKPQVQTLPSQDSVPADDDITWEIIEEGGDQKEPAQFISPDLSFAELDALFQPTFYQRVETSIHTPVSKSSQLGERQIRKLRVAYGGDYQHIPPQHFVTPPSELGPLKHAQLVLSRRSDVSVPAKNGAVAIISSAVGGATGSREVQGATPLD